METIAISSIVASFILLVAFLTLALKSLAYINERPTRNEVVEMIDGKLETMNLKIDGVAKDVKRVADAMDRTKKR